MSDIAIAALVLLVLCLAIKYAQNIKQKPKYSSDMARSMIEDAVDKMQESLRLAKNSDDPAIRVVQVEHARLKLKTVQELAEKYPAIKLVNMENVKNTIDQLSLQFRANGDYARVEIYGSERVDKKRLGLFYLLGLHDFLKKEDEKALARIAAMQKTRVKTEEQEVRIEKLGIRNAIELQGFVEKTQEELKTEKEKLAELQRNIVQTEEIAMLQEAGVYRYRHPLADVTAYEHRLQEIENGIKNMIRQDDGAVVGITSWTVNGSEAEGRKMVKETSKLMLRAFNAEADNAVRTLKPHKLDAAIDRLLKVSETISKLGRAMKIKITPQYIELRTQELELTADFLQKEAEKKEAEREERERLREERKANAEMQRERERLEKEQQHYANVLATLEEKGDALAAERMRAQLEEVQRAIKDVDFRAANIRAGYVYVISNIGAFGENMVKIGMTRRLDPMDRVNELGDASVPFRFDVHALFFSKDAVTIETKLHQRFFEQRVNKINQRREFFRVTPQEVKIYMAELAGDLLEFKDVPEALEYREGLAQIAP